MLSSISSACSRKFFHLVTHEIKPNSFVKWQGGFGAGAFTVSSYNIDKVANYIRNQGVYDNQKTLISSWEM